MTSAIDYVNLIKVKSNKGNLINMSEFSELKVSKEEPKEWYGRSYPKYEAAVHIPLLKETYLKGGGMLAFCADAQITRRTFWDWTTKHLDFKEQYEISMCEGGRQWELLPLQLAKEGITLNNRYWEIVARARYKYSQIQIEKEKEDTTASRMAAAWISMQQGGITPQEYNQIASGLSTESKILEVELQREIVDQLKEQAAASKEMTDEALKAFMLVKSGKGKVVENER